MPKNDAMTASDAVTETAVAVAVQDPGYHLIVVHPFGVHQKGAHINDATEIANVLASENAGSCNKVPPLN